MAGAIDVLVSSCDSCAELHEKTLACFAALDGRTEALEQEVRQLKAWPKHYGIDEKGGPALLGEQRESAGSEGLPQGYFLSSDYSLSKEGLADVDIAGIYATDSARHNKTTKASAMVGTSAVSGPMESDNGPLTDAANPPRPSITNCRLPRELRDHVYAYLLHGEYTAHVPEHGQATHSAHYNNHHGLLGWQDMDQILNLTAEDMALIHKYREHGLPISDFDELQQLSDEPCTASPLGKGRSPS